MLHFIRERAQGWVAWFIVGLISIPFALWGVNSYLGGASEVVIATVNGEPIQQAEYQRSLQQFRDRMRQQMGDNFDPSLIDNPETKQQILDQLIQRKLLLSAHDTLGQQVSNQVVSQVVQQTDAFQVDGQFDMERYKTLLARAGFSPATYEAQLRMDLLNQELTNHIQQSALVTEQDIEHILMLEKQQRDMAYGLLKAADYIDDVNVTETDIETYYAQHQQQFTTPEQMAVDYIELSLADLMAEVAVDDDTLMTFYQDNQAQFRREEQRRASHILIEGDAETAIKILTAAKYRISQGEAFDVVAKELSQDTGSASQGGDLGFLQAGTMEDDAFDDALFGLASVGDVSDVVETEFGHHLIQVTEIKEGEEKPFAEVKSEVEQLYRRQEAQQLFYDRTELLAELSYEYPDSLDTAAEELSLTIQSSALFGREGGEGIAQNIKVVNAAFSDDVLQEELNSAVIELTDNRVVVLHKKSHRAASQQSIESVSEQIKQVLQAEQAQQQAKTEGEMLLEKMNEGTDPATLFAEWHESQLVSRAQTEIDPAILEQAFAMAKPTDTPTYHGFSNREGDYVVVALNKVVDGDISAVTEQDKAGLSAYLARSQGDSELRAFLASLKADADIEMKSNL